MVGNPGDCRKKVWDGVCSQWLCWMKSYMMRLEKTSLFFLVSRKEMGLKPEWSQRFWVVVLVNWFAMQFKESIIIWCLDMLPTIQEANLRRSQVTLGLVIWKSWSTSPPTTMAPPTWRFQTWFSFQQLVPSFDWRELFVGDVTGPQNNHFSTLETLEVGETCITDLPGLFSCVCLDSDLGLKSFTPKAWSLC